MLQASPTGEISVCSNNNYTNSSSSTSSSSSSIRYIYTIDLKFNDELEQKKTKKYPFIPKSLKQTLNKITDYQNENQTKGYETNENLMLNLTDKKDYVRKIVKV